MKTIKQTYDEMTLSPHRKEIILHNLLLHNSSHETSFKHSKVILSIVTICIIAFIIIPHILINQKKENTLINPKNTNQINCTLNDIPHDISNIELQNMNFYVYANTRVFHQDILDAFIDDVHKNQTSYIRIAVSTDEGDPILTEVYFNPEKGVTIYYDTTRDDFGVQALSEYHYQKIGVYQETLYAYNHELNQNVIENNEAFFITYTHLQS